MIVAQTAIPEILINERRVFEDPRGALFEAYNQQKLSECGVR
jgi:dTDP-4-dehydrorhamnose 3,5-epimerase-like enzyme